MNTIKQLGRKISQFYSIGSRLIKIPQSHLKVVDSSEVWRSDEAFDTSWKLRICQMAKYIDEGESVLDIGCGKGWLREYLPHDCRYIGCDLVKRDKDTIVCDFNAYQFPEQIADVVFISGVLE